MGWGVLGVGRGRGGGGAGRLISPIHSERVDQVPGTVLGGAVEEISLPCLPSYFLDSAQVGVISG